MITSDIKSAESGFYLALQACGKPPYVLGDKSDKIHKTKTSQISLRGFVVEMSRNASAVTITPSKPLGSKNRI